MVDVGGGEGNRFAPALPIPKVSSEASKHCCPWWLLQLLSALMHAEVQRPPILHRCPPPNHICLSVPSSSTPARLQPSPINLLPLLLSALHRLASTSIGPSTSTGPWINGIWAPTSQCPYPDKLCLWPLPNSTLGQQAVWACQEARKPSGRPCFSREYWTSPTITHCRPVILRNHPASCMSQAACRRTDSLPRNTGLILHLGCEDTHSRIYRVQGPVLLPSLACLLCLAVGLTLCFWSTSNKSMQPTYSQAARLICLVAWLLGCSLLLYLQALGQLIACVQQLCSALIACLPSHFVFHRRGSAHILLRSSFAHTYTPFSPLHSSESLHAFTTGANRRAGLDAPNLNLIHTPSLQRFPP
jgi:hypothetical protein